VVTETPPGTLNGFGSMQENFYQNLEPTIIFTDNAFKDFGEERGYTFGQVPYHRGKKHFFKFAIGLIPEWRGYYSKKWISKKIPFKIDTVFSFVYSPSTIKWSEWISRVKNCKLIIHVADHNKFFFEEKSLKILNKAHSVFVISEKMKKLYEKYTHRNDIKVFHNFPDNRCYPKDNAHYSTNRVFSSESPLMITFIGGLYSYLHKDSIEDLIKSISTLHSSGKKIELRFYGARHPSTFLEKELSMAGITHHGLVKPLEKKYQIMHDSDAFVLPSSFNPKINEEYKYSFPSKLTELVATGKPIIYYGPSDTAASEFLSEINGTIIINEKSSLRISDSLCQLLIDYSDIVRTSKESRSRFKKEFSKNRILSEFNTQLERTVLK
jgi:glycosyltransferase involved in cell wall biosynthesis